jgi:hypothetical protein
MRRIYLAGTVLAVLVGLGLAGAYHAVQAQVITQPRVPTVVITPSSASGAAIAPSAVAAITGAQLLKASAGNLYGFNVTSSTTAGYVLLFNSATVPADGAVTPVKCYKLSANSTISGSWLPGPAARFSSGIVIVYSTTGCFTKTVEDTAFISGDYQ